MKIVADENIPLLMECFGGMGEVVALPGREISAEDVKEADALLVRSVTRVDAALLEGSSVKFVGTATAGFDHIDREYLQSRHVAFSHAPGCNATAVVEYVLAALDVLSERDGFSLQDRRVGIVGKGQVGGRLYQMMKRLGVTVCACDPFLEQGLLEQEKGGDDDVHFVSLDKLIETSDVICLHTPLTTDGPYPSYHMIDTPQLASMKRGTILINAGRGAVVNNEALKETLGKRQDITVVLDVWEFEPDADTELMNRVAIATPHIAGYSLDGKIRGTGMIYKALCHCFGLPARVRMAAVTPLPVLKQMSFFDSVEVSETCSRAIRAVYDIRRDDSCMRKALLGLEQSDRMQAFDRLRKQYPDRREFTTLKVSARDCSESIIHTLDVMNFKLS